MKNYVKPVYWAFALLLVLMAGCKDDNLYNAAYVEEIKSQLFDFNLRTDVTVDINFGISDYRALVMLFDENPLGEDGELSDVVPLYSSYTDENCRLQTTIEVPASTETVYVFSPTFWIPRLTEVSVKNGAITLDTTSETASVVTSNVKATKAIENPSIVSTIDADKGFYALVDWNQLGVINDVNGLFSSTGGLSTDELTAVKSYLWKGSGTKPYGLDNTALIRDTEHINTSIAEAYVNDEGETVLTDYAEISFTFAHERAQYENTVGYYYYPTDECPTSSDGVKKFVIIPNASTLTDNDPVYCLGTRDDYTKLEVSPIENNTTIQLLFEKEDGTLTTQFPPNYTIGYFVLSDAFTVGGSHDSYNASDSYWRRYRFFNEYSDNVAKGTIDLSNLSKTFICSNKEWNSDSEAHFISISYNDNIIYGVEDGNDDSYEDILFMIAANPSGAIQDPDRPVINPDTETTTTTFASGIYAFEDIWSSGGDYDMNDVIVQYDRKYTYNLYNEITNITETYTPVHNGATYHDSFGITLPYRSSDIASITVNGETLTSVNVNANSQGLRWESNVSDSVTLVLFDDIQDVKGLSYTVSLTPNDDALEVSDIQNSGYNPFIVVPELNPSDNLRLEVHLPKYSVTGIGWPGAGEAWNLWFVGRYEGKQYPFGIDIPYKSFKPAAETVLITNAYTDFDNWVESSGASYTDWYKNPTESQVQDFNWE